MATHTSRLAEFANPVLLAAVNTSENEWWLWPSGDELFFTVTRASVTSIHRASRVAGGSYSFGAEVAELHVAGSTELGPMLTVDGLTIYLTRSSGGPSQIMRATRPSRSDAFGVPKPVDELNSGLAFNDTGWVSPDGCTIYFASSRDDAGETRDIHRATKPGL